MMLNVVFYNNTYYTLVYIYIYIYIYIYNNNIDKLGITSW